MRYLVFVPALLCIGATAFIASGASLVPGASAVSTVSITGNIGSSFSTDPTVSGGAGATGCADETLTTFAAAFAASNGCTITFNTNNVNGATVAMDNNYSGANDANGFFCVDPDVAGPAARNCGAAGAGGTEARVDNVAAVNSTITSDTFGVALMSVGGSGGTAAGTGAPTVNAAPVAATAAWNPIPANGAGSQLCHSTGPNTAVDSTCQFKFGGQGSGASQAAGDYSGTMRLTTSLL
ncbi:MAG: hypothetical protein JWN41_228 [Thermoleophilia bacterium]|nr:hypothetical protein [Thermoleophilia bacterium]